MPSVVLERERHLAAEFECTMALVCRLYEAQEPLDTCRATVLLYAEANLAAKMFAVGRKQLVRRTLCMQHYGASEEQGESAM